MKRIDWNLLDEAGRAAALARPAARADASLKAAVRAIVEDVRDRGWDALVEQATRIDGAPPRLVKISAIAAEARRALPAEQLDAIELASANIRRFHEASLPAECAAETVSGLIVRKVWRPLDRVGLYVPGGKTPLFSSLLMLAIPAAVAGVREVITVTPPSVDGSLDPMIALAADIAGIDAIWTVGGAQAIAALAFGAGDIPPVDRICGPGNAWVAEAKALVSSMPGGPPIDMPAGPSELMVIADENADPVLVAADLLSQAEHDAAAQVLLVATSAEVADRVAGEVERQVEALPRHEIATASLANARLIVAPVEQAAGIANAYAPEHLSLAVADAEALLPSIRNAGAVFVGGLAAESFGDYLAGSSHVLPTDGAARAWSGVSVHTFLKSMTVQTVTPAAARRLAGPAAELARMEGLEAHARAAELRAA